MFYKRYKYISLLVICSILSTYGGLSAQWSLQLEHIEKKEIDTFERQDSTQVMTHLDSMLREDFLEGRLTASIDYVESKDSTIKAIYYQGPRFAFGKLDYDQNDFLMSSILSRDIRQLENEVLDISSINKIYTKIITAAENSGYPFASIHLQNMDLSTDTLKGSLVLERSHLIMMDSINKRGNLAISDGFLYNYLNIKKGQAFDRSKIKAIDQKLKNLSFLSLKKEPQISFVNNKAIIHLDMAKRKSSHFDFLVGLLQNNTPEGQKYIVTGSFTAEMINKLSYGERIYLQYQRLKAETQELDIAFDYPYILGTSFGTSLDFKLFRNETSFLDAVINVGGQYYLQGRDYLKATWNYKTSRLLDVDTTFLLNNKRLPDNLDVTYNGLGVGMKINQLDYIFNPRDGFVFQLDGDIGVKKIIENTTILGFTGQETLDFSEAYDTIDLNTYQVALKLDAAYFQPVSNNITIKTGIKSGWIYNEKKLYQNELFRIGGNKLLRGFDEQSIKSSFYTVLTAELRFILAQQSNNFTLSLPFIDFGFEYNPYRLEGNLWDRPIGVGVGMDFQTSAGLFNFAIAAGKRLTNPLDFGNLKIHFGYVNLF